MGANSDIICQKFARAETVYMKDDFYDMALRFYRNERGEECYFRKSRKNYGKWAAECPIDPKVSNTAFEVTLGGEFITKEEYDEFDSLPPQY